MDSANWTIRLTRTENLNTWRLMDIAFESLLTTSDAAQLLRVHVNTLRLWAREGRVPCLRLGRKVAFRASALNRWVDQQVESQQAVRAA